VDYKLEYKEEINTRELESNSRSNVGGCAIRSHL